MRTNVASHFFVLIYSTQLRSYPKFSFRFGDGKMFASSSLLYAFRAIYHPTPKLHTNR